MRKLIAVALWLLGLAAFIYGTMFLWLLRDGLKVGMVESHGLQAWQNMWNGGALLVDLLLLLILISPLLVAGCYIYPLRFRRRTLQNDKKSFAQEGTWPPTPKPPAA